MTLVLSELGEDRSARSKLLLPGVYSNRPAISGYRLETCFRKDLTYFHQGGGVS